MSSCAYNYYIQAHSIRIGQFIANLTSVMCPEYSKVVASFILQSLTCGKLGLREVV